MNRSPAAYAKSQIRYGPAGGNISIARRLSLLLLAALALGGAPAAAKDADYVGTWGKYLAQCKIGQEMENAPMIVKPRRYDRHETHCAFTSYGAKERRGE